MMNKLMNKVTAYVATQKRLYKEEMVRQNDLAEQARIEGEAIGRNIMKGVYTPSYVAGYATEAVTVNVKKAADKIASTKVAQYVANKGKDMKFSAQKGYSNGKKDYHMAIVEKQHEIEWQALDADYEESFNAYLEHEAIIMAGGPLDEDLF